MGAIDLGLVAFLLLVFVVWTLLRRVNALERRIGFLEYQEAKRAERDGTCESD